ncbi:hypothetical protein Belba_0210 [Belliella baltica DSM 15883]|uniref:Uncharacterized protein n=1 Tax=Belliella baltica (strain DSM 15883 / CIP 108006 / LMG 21964 / BA134) TaxID=866536 RepID=I3Z0W0_BELBD|nr:hypothetical protein Belba_0210 [Belliella baltica DSM 15883]
MVGSSDLIFDKPYHIINDTLFSFDSYQSKITKTPLNGEEGNELILSFSFDEQPSTFYYINSDSIVFSTGNTLFISDQKGIQYHSIRLFSKLDKNNQYLLQENHIF